MIKIKNKKGTLFLFFIFLIGIVCPLATSDTFFGDIQTGLIEINDFRYPVFMYVPENIKPGRKYPLLITIPDEGETPDETIARWKSIATRMTLIVLTPTYKKLDDLPNAFDRWFFQVKELLSNVYPVNPQKIFLIGEKGGAAYASYLGVMYPEQFSAVALLEGSWIGQFEKLMRLESSSLKQLPFYVAMKAGQKDLIAKTETKAYEFEQKGYPVVLKTFDDEKDFSKRDFKKEMINWLSDKSDDWSTVVDKDKTKWTEKLKKRTKNFFTI